MLKKLAILFTAFAISAGSAQNFGFHRISPVNIRRVLPYFGGSERLLAGQRPTYNTFEEYRTRYGNGGDKLRIPFRYYPQNNNRRYRNYGLARNLGIQGFRGGRNVFFVRSGKPTGFSKFSRDFSSEERDRDFSDEFSNENSIGQHSNSNEFGRANFIRRFSSEDSGSDEFSRGSFFGSSSNEDSDSNEFSRESFFGSSSNEDSGSNEFSRGSFFGSFSNEDSGSSEFSRENFFGSSSNEDSDSNEFGREQFFRRSGNKDSGSNEFSRESFYGSSSNEDSGSNEFSREGFFGSSSNEDSDSDSNEFSREGFFGSFSNEDSNSNERSGETYSNKLVISLQRRANRRGFKVFPVFAMRRHRRRLIGFLSFRNSARGITGERYISLRNLRYQFLKKRDSSEENFLSFSPGDSNERYSQNRFSSIGLRNSGGSLVNQHFQRKIPFHVINIGGPRTNTANAIRTRGQKHRYERIRGLRRKGNVRKSLRSFGMRRDNRNIGRFVIHNGKRNTRYSNTKAGDSKGKVSDDGARNYVFSAEDGSDSNAESDEISASNSRESNWNELNRKGVENIGETGTDKGAKDNNNHINNGGKDVVGENTELENWDIGGIVEDGQGHDVNLANKGVSEVEILERIGDAKVQDRKVIESIDLGNVLVDAKINTVVSGVEEKLEKEVPVIASIADTGVAKSNIENAVVESVPENKLNGTTKSTTKDEATTPGAGKVPAENAGVVELVENSGGGLKEFDKVHDNVLDEIPKSSAIKDVEISDKAFEP